jgi:uncharacterized protein YukE
MPHTFRRARVIAPGEAPAIASNLRGIARDIRTLAGQMASALRTLDATWHGRARERFFLDFSHVPNKAGDASVLTELVARQVETATVTVWETVTEADGPHPQ